MSLFESSETVGGPSADRGVSCRTGTRRYRRVARDWAAPEGANDGRIGDLGPWRERDSRRRRIVTHF